MKKSEQIKVIEILRKYLALGIAEKNLKEKIAAGEQLVQSVGMAVPPSHAHGGTAEKGNGASALFSSGENEQMFLLDRYRSELSVIRAEKRAVERSLGAMDQEEKRILTAFYLNHYTSDTPFDLMEQLGYEKSALYRVRQKALYHFSCFYDGNIGRG